MNPDERRIPAEPATSGRQSGRYATISTFVLLSLRAAPTSGTDCLSRHVHLSALPGTNSNRGRFVNRRVHQGEVDRIRTSLSPRDLAVLDQVRDLRLMSGAQIQAVHFTTSEHETHEAALRACRRVLQRLHRDGLLIRLHRHVGGIRAGSQAFIYAASPLGYRVLDDDGTRRRFREPTATFVNHTLAIAEVVVALVEAQRAKQLDILRLEVEPRCWRRYRSTYGNETVRPDLFVAIGVGEYEHHCFVEIDLGTETFVRRITKCRQYEQYYRAGDEQAAHGLFPRVLWVMNSDASAGKLRDRIDRTAFLTNDIFSVTTTPNVLAALTRGAP